MHKGLHRAYATSPHDINSTIEALYSISYRLPRNRADGAGHVLRSIKKHALWANEQHSSWRLHKPMGLEGVTGVCENQTGCLETLAGAG